MFHDERINAECGKIYSRGILLAVLITLFYTLSRTVTLLIQGELQTVVTYTEAVILLLGTGILTVGAVRFPRRGDERTAYERHAYYKKAGIGFILAVLGAYILTIPFTTKEMLGGQPHNHLLILLEVLGYLYLFYAFKTKEIHFNYSFIAEDGSQYYRRVLLRIGGLFLGLFPPFVLAAAWELILHKSWIGALTILLAYVSSAVGLSIEYFFISLVEKTSYDTLDGCRFALGTRIAMLVSLAVEFSLSVLQCVYVHFVTGNLQEIPNIGSIGTVIAVVSQMQTRIGLLLVVLVGLTVCHILSQIKKGTLLYAVCRVKMLLLALTAIEATVSPVWYRALSENAIHILVNEVTPILRFASFAITLTMWILFVRGAVKELGAPRILRAIPGAYVLITAVNIYFTSQSMLRTATYAEQIVKIACLVLLSAVVWRYRGFADENSDSISMS